MRLLVSTLAGASVVAVALAACQPAADMGYVELKTVPASTSASQPTFYLDMVKLDPLKKGVAVLRQRVGTAKLATDGTGGNPALLCDVVVKKNRITTVTVSVLERPLRCQCRSGGGKDSAARTCVS
jgi:hypothetical protein